MFDIKNHFLLHNSYALTKVIIYEFQRSRKFDYLYSYSMSDEANHYIGYAMFLSLEKQKSFGLPIRYKSVPITFNKSQVLAIGNQYHKDST